MLQTIITTFSSYFSRSFWFGSFLPILIVAFLHGLLVAAVFRPNWLTLDIVLTLGAEEAGKASLVFGLMVVMGYMLTPFIPLFIRVLDGSLLPKWLYDKLRKEREEDWRNSTDALSKELEGFSDIQMQDEKLRQELDEKRAAGASKGITDILKIEKAAEALQELTPSRWKRLSDNAEDFERAADAIKAALEANSTEVQGDANEAWAKKLDKIDGDFRELLTRRLDEGRQRFDAQVRRSPEFDLKGWEATRLGDARRAMERYPENMYGARYEWLWPRLALALPAQDTGLTLRIQDANAQLNFSLLLIVLFQTIALVWLPLIFLTGEKIWLALLLGWLAPLANLALYELVVQSQIAFGGVAATAIDSHQFTLLTTLHQPLPATLSAERALWNDLSRAELPNLGIDLIYKKAGEQ